MGDTTVYSAIRFVCDPPVFVLPAVAFFFDGSAMATLFCIGSLQTPRSLWRCPHLTYLINLKAWCVDLLPASQCRDSLVLASFALTSQRPPHQPVVHIPILEDSTKHGQRTG